MSRGAGETEGRFLLSPQMPEIETPLGRLHLERDPVHSWDSPGERSGGVALLIHGYAAWHGSWMMELLARSLEMPNLRLDMPGVGPSGGVYSASPIADAEAVKEAIRALRREGMQVDVLVGHSRGAVAALTAAAEMEESESGVKKIILIAPRYHHEYLTLGKLSEAQLTSLKDDGFFIEEFKDIMGGQKVRVTHEMLMDRVQFDNKKRCILLRDKHIKVLFIHGTEDKISPDSDIDEFLSDIRGDGEAQHPSISCSVTLECINGADHSFRGHEKELCSIINDFLRK